jgi:hypothetical protein
MGGTTMLTGGPRLPEGERCERERVESLTGGAGLSEVARAREAGPPGPGRRGGRKRGRGASWARIGLAEGGGFFSFSVFYFFSFHFLFLFLFISFSLESIIF